MRSQLKTCWFTWCRLVETNHKKLECTEKGTFNVYIRWEPWFSKIRYWASGRVACKSCIHFDKISVIGWRNGSSELAVPITNHGKKPLLAVGTASSPFRSPNTVKTRYWLLERRARRSGDHTQEKHIIDRDAFAVFDIFQRWKHNTHRIFLIALYNGCNPSLPNAIADTGLCHFINLLRSLL